MYALFFGVIGAGIVIGLIQYMLPDWLRIMPYVMVVMLYLLFMKSKAPGASFKQLTFGAVLMALTATLLVYTYIVLFFWQDLVNNPLNQSIPVWDHAIIIGLSVMGGSGIGALLAYLFTFNWGVLRRT